MTDAEVFTIPIGEAYPMKDTIIVTTQEEMDAVIADASIAHRIEVRGNGLISVNPQCPLDVLVFDSVTVTACGSAAVWACDSSKVNACDSSMVWASDSSKVTAYDSSAVTAYDSSKVNACGSATVTAFNSSTVTARGSAAVWACDSSTVTAFDSSTVAARDSSTVTSYGSSEVTSFNSSTVTACDSSTVWAFNSSTVTACGSSTVTAFDSSTVNATAAGATITIHTTTDATTPTRWATENGAPVSGGEVKLYKALPDDLTSGLLYGRPTVWAVGEEVTCDDWRADDKCGGGLHLSPTPGHAWQHLDYETRPRFLECVAPIDTIIPLHGDVAKCKAPRVRVVREVDMAGHQVTSEGAAS